MIPFYVFYWAFRIDWRFMYLPYRDKPPRSDEAGRLDLPPPLTEYVRVSDRCKYGTHVRR